MTANDFSGDLPLQGANKVENNATQMTLAEMSLAYSVHVERIVEMVWEGVIDPEGHSRDEWRFSDVQFRQIGVAVRLQRDLGVNLPGVALALQLLSEIQDLRSATA